MQVTMSFQLKGYGVRSLVLLRQGHESLLSGLPVTIALTKLRETDYKTSLLQHYYNMVPMHQPDL